MKNKVVLITGCSSGIGQSLCGCLKERGYIVVATARVSKKISDLNADMKLELDVTQQLSVDAAVEKVIGKYGRVDILVNNAGYSFRSAVEEIEIDKMKKMYEVNVYGIVRMIQAVVPYMREQHSGKILNIGSISGRFTGLINGCYCSTKHSVEAITEAARYELKKYNIGVAVIEPGAMDTGFFETLAINSEKQMSCKTSPYADLYLRDITYRKKQKRASVEDSASQIADIIDKDNMKIRYTIALSVIFKMLVHMPDRIKEALVLKFN